MSQIAESLCPNIGFDSQNSRQNSDNSQQNSDSQQTSKRTRGIITMQPNSSQSGSTSTHHNLSESSNNPPKKKNKKVLRTPFEIYESTKPLTAGEANQSRMVSSRRHSIEVFILDFLFKSNSSHLYFRKFVNFRQLMVQLNSIIYSKRRWIGRKLDREWVWPVSNFAVPFTIADLSKKIGE